MPSKSKQDLPTAIFMAVNGLSKHFKDGTIKEASKVLSSHETTRIYFGAVKSAAQQEGVELPSSSVVPDLKIWSNLEEIIKPYIRENGDSQLVAKELAKVIRKAAVDYVVLEKLATQKNAQKNLAQWEQKFTAEIAA